MWYSLFLSRQFSPILETIASQSDKVKHFFIFIFSRRFSPNQRFLLFQYQVWNNNQHSLESRCNISVMNYFTVYLNFWIFKRVISITFGIRIFSQFITRCYYFYNMFKLVNGAKMLYLSSNYLIVKWYNLWPSQKWE